MRAAILFIFLALVAGQTQADDRKDLQKLLDSFIAGAANSTEVHKRFWAEDLIYTSSSGKRFGKSQIIQGMESSSTEPVTTSYAAEDVDIRLLGDTAVIAFKLVANDTSSKETSHFFNTGTFVKRNGEWQVIAWQATKIPTES
ncbi:nuclear transport factor 2 family protein [Microbulbifer variabilis]|uniref:nuclear transport factor 2 family protein n=1 Tax=Microbulbifer variabilis TaxID=266805 RepID=UPI0003752D34|nr:nuclear transport factor 2 family protein [Microbulbifer variabilis]